MARKGKLASERLKMEAAEEVGFADKVRREGWGNATTKEIGLMVKEMVRRGENILQADDKNKPPR
ncbi:MAG: small, acid-soluble spore protein, alpha/beta type [Firmicutes bacterium]|mgnify:CR=1 FL=1|nr:small, acid-soluble spore protein, alpha/beta type [Bacillota bacterium]